MPTMADQVIDSAERLQDAIDRLSTRRLARLCHNLCAKNPSARTFFEAHLFVEEDKVPGPKLPEPENLRPFGYRPGPEDDDNDDDEESDEDDENDEDGKENEKSAASEPTRKPKSLKRSRPRFAVCTNCKKEFDVAENTSESCKYHSDKSYPDEEFFADHDENCHGIIDTDEMRKEYPDGFIYACCDRNGEEVPCKQDWHIPTDPEAAKRRLIQRGGLVDFHELYPRGEPCYLNTHSQFNPGTDINRS